MLVCLTLIFALGKFVFGIALFLMSVAMWLFSFFVNRTLVHQYMCCYWMCKNKNLNHQILQKNKDIMSTIWEMSSPRVRKKIKETIEKDKKQLEQSVSDEQKKEKKRTE